jgi:hypothetical protein
MPIVRILLFIFLVGAGTDLLGQINPDPGTGLQNYFTSWYKDAIKNSKKSKRRGLEKEVVSLYLVAVNGSVGEAGDRIFLSGVRPPRGKFSLVQNQLNYIVIEKFPISTQSDPDGYSSGWRAIYDSLRANPKPKEHLLDRINIHPDKFVVPGLPLSEEKNKELWDFMEGDSVSQKNTEEPWTSTESRMKSGARYKWLSEWVSLIEPHWGYRWIYRSFPIISDVYVDKKATQALLGYRIHNGGGYAHFKKIKTGWVLTESRITILQ